MTESTLDFSSPTLDDSPPPRYGQLAQHFVLLDGNNLAMRSFHAAKGRLSAYDTARGETVETGSLHLFVISLSKWLRQFKPTHFVVCWDGGRSQHRERIYPEYKSARKKKNLSPEVPHAPAFALIGEFLMLCGIEQWFRPGVEADDLIAAGHRVTRQTYPESLITIMSSDKDLLQLLDDYTQQLRFSSYGTETDMWTRQRVIKDLGYTPEQVPLMMALTGDRGDGIPGADKIGPVRALKMLSAHDWDLTKIANSLPDGDMVKISYQLVNLLGELCCDVEPVPEYGPLARFSKNSTVRLEKLTDFCARYRLAKLWEGVVDGSLWW